MRRGRGSSRGGHGDEEVPWASFADALTGLLFVFIVLTVKFVMDAQKAKAEAEEERSELTGARERARALAAQDRVGSIAHCVFEEGRNVVADLKLVQGKGADDTALSVVLPEVERVGWFETADATLRGQACDTTRVIARCVARAMPSVESSSASSGSPILLKHDRLRVLVEGHTDSHPLAAGEAFATNWELSGARAAAVVRALTVAPSACADLDDVAVVAGAMAESRLELIAAGRADQAPSWAVVCGDKPAASPDPVCACDKDDASSQAKCVREEAAKVDGEKDPQGGEVDAGMAQQSLINWANKTPERRRSMRRVDLRFEVLPSLGPKRPEDGGDQDGQP